MKNFNSEHKTKFTIQLTHIKCLDEKTDTVETLDCFGKLSQLECKNICKGNDLIFISKTNTTKEHELLTSELINLV